MKGLKEIASVYIASFFGVIIMLVIIFTGWVKPLNEFFDKCWVGESNDHVLQALRGNNYWMSLTEKPKPRFCLFTTWALTHVILYAIIGFMYPTMFWPAFLIGVGFEILEWVTFDCHDILDIVWNSVGFFLGAMLKLLLSY